MYLMHLMRTREYCIESSSYARLYVRRSTLISVRYAYLAHPAPTAARPQHAAETVSGDAG